MNLSLIGLLIGFVAAWSVSVSQRASRNWRFIVALGAWSVVLAATLVWSSQLGRFIEIGLAGIWLAAVSKPDRFWIGAWTTSDLAMHRTLTAVRSALDDATGPRLAEAEGLLGSPTLATADGAWASAIRLYRGHVAGLRAGATDDHLRQAGTHYWSVAMNRRVIGAREHPSLRDEGALLRCFSEEFNALIPRAEPGEMGPRLSQDWAGQAYELVEALAATDVVSEPARELQDTLEEAMEAGIDVALGEGSPGATSRYQAAEEELRLGWERMTPPVR